MSRRRYLSTDISKDGAVNRLAMRGGDFAAMLYTWMVPHAGDDGSLPSDPEELMFVVIPGRRDKSVEEVIAALEAMRDLNLIVWDDDGIRFPAKAFYRYQTYIKEGNRRGANQQETPQDSDNSAEPRESAQNTANNPSRASRASLPIPIPIPISPSVKSPTESGPDKPPANEHKQMSVVLSETEGYAPNARLTKNEWSRFGAAAKELLSLGATADEVRLRAARYKRAHLDWEYTANALISHWGKLAIEPSPRAASDGKHPTPIRVDTVPLDSRWADITFEAKRWQPGTDPPRFDEGTDRAIESLGGWQQFVRDGSKREAFERAYMGVRA